MQYINKTIHVLTFWPTNPTSMNLSWSYNSNNMKMYMEKVILSRIFGNCKNNWPKCPYIDYWLNQMCLYIVSTMHHKEEWRRSQWINTQISYMYNIKYKKQSTKDQIQYVRFCVEKKGKLENMHLLICAKRNTRSMKQN